MNWETIGYVAFVAAGIIQFAKGFFKNADGKIWAALQVVLCFGLPLLWGIAPTWAKEGFMAVSASQLCYENILQPIKKKLNPDAEATT